MKMILPEDVSYIIHKLEDAGYEAFAVGGCVRDTILGRTPLDWDITTSAQPSFVKSCFRRTIDTGIKHVQWLTHDTQSIAISGVNISISHPIASTRRYY